MVYWMKESWPSMLVGQAGASALPQQLTQLTGLPIIDSWQGALFLMIALWAFLARRRGESLITMDEQTHLKRLEGESKVQSSQGEQIKEYQAQLKELQARAAKELDETRHKLHESRNENLKLLERAMKAEAQCEQLKAEHAADKRYLEREAQRLREDRDYFIKICEDAAQDMKLNGLHEASEQIVEQMTEASDLSNPDILPKPNKR